MSQPNPGPNYGYGGQYPPNQQTPYYPPQQPHYPPQQPPQPQYPQTYQQQYQQYQPQPKPAPPPPQPGVPLCNQHPLCRALSSVPLQVLRPHFLPAVLAPSPELGGDPVGRALSDDLMLVLSVRGGPHGLGGERSRSGDSDGYVVAQHLASAWPIAVDELWRQAFINQRLLELKVFPVAAMNAPPAIQAVAGNDWTVGAQAFRLEEVLRTALPYGALVTVANAKSMFVWPVASKRELQNMAFFLETARELGQALGPRLSSRCFWLYQGTLHDLSVRDVSGGDAKITLSAAMRDVFLSLPEAPATR